MSRKVMDAKTALNILKSRTMLVAGVINNVQVTNVSFVKPDGTPFRDANWDDGKPYAIANFNLVNAYGKSASIQHLANGRFQEACNTNESMRVTPELGKKLLDAQYATIVGKPRTWTVTDETTGVDSEITAVKIHKAVPSIALDASESVAYGDELENALTSKTATVETENVDTAGMPE